MRPFFKCELNYLPFRHLNQIYDGFEKLRKNKIIELVLKPAKTGIEKPLLKVILNNKYTVVYDTLDGLNWINGSIKENLIYFQENTKADFYFKRSYTKKLLDFSPYGCKIFPLGLNFGFKPEGDYPSSFLPKLKNLIKGNFFYSKFSSKTNFLSQEFEHYPVPSKENKILFLARLWNPNDVNSLGLKEEREIINNNRVSCIRTCRKEFGSIFYGGLQSDEFSNRYANDLVFPTSVTKRESFLKSVKKHNICIATTGLHNSIGGKFGEYVAASRAIISEPLEYELPGEFKSGLNYLEYTDEMSLVNNIQDLLNNKGRIASIMKRNFDYYNNFLRSDVLVLNSLLKVQEEIE